MSLRTQIWQLLPWEGGLNTSLDPAVIPPNQLVVADNIIFSERTSKKKRAGIKSNWDDVTTDTAVSLIGLHDFWYVSGGSKTHTLVSVTNEATGVVRRYNISTGAATALTVAGTAISSATQVTMCTLLNTLIIACDGSSNVLKKYTGSGSVENLGGTPPGASIVQAHLGRLFCNDKTNKDRLHYSPTYDLETWNGSGDSGALDIGIGDGDPEGITAIFPPFKGDLFVAKKTKLYRISGLTPEEWIVTLVSDNIGCIGPNAVAAVDNDDVIFVSERGVHSLKATDAYGDFQGAFLSKDIQKSFNDDWDNTRKKHTYARYLPTINAVAFTVSDSEFNATKGSAIWFFHVEKQQWFRWANIDCQSLAVSTDGDKKRFYIGRSDERLSKTFLTTDTDTTTAGANSGIRYKVKTGRIYPDNNPYTLKGFKRIVIYHRPLGTYNATVRIKIDNRPEQTLSYSGDSGSDLLGSTFILGSSALGSALSTSPYSKSISGYGHSIQITIEQTDASEDIEIQGIGVEYEVVGTSPEVEE